MRSPFAPEQEVITPDGRRQVRDPLAVPYRWICSLDVMFGSTLMRGTGVLIGPRHVLTAAHNIYRPDGNGPSSTYVVPARNGPSEPFGRVRAVAHSVTGAFLRHHRANSRFDFALLTLERDVSRLTHRGLGSTALGYWGHPQLGHGTLLRALPANLLHGKPVVVCGYPGDWCGTARLDPKTGCSKRDQATVQFSDFGPASFQPGLDGLLLHAADTHPGQSGSPVWIKFTDGSRYLVGVHVGPDRVYDTDTRRFRPVTANRAVHLTDSVLQVLHEWLPDPAPAMEAERREAATPPRNPPRAHPRFDHVLREIHLGPNDLMPPGSVPATPARLNTPFYDAAVVGSHPDRPLQGALDGVISTNVAYRNAGSNLAVALVDLSGANRSSPKYAGHNDLANFYGASINKIAGLMGVHQLLADADDLLATEQHIADSAGLATALESRWNQAGIAAPDHPLVSYILDVRPGSPPTAKIRSELLARLDRISAGNQNGSTPITLLKFPFIGSVMLAYGLFSPPNGGGLWTRQAYGPVVYRGRTFTLPNWSRGDNPHPNTFVHNVNAVSLAQFYTLAAQGRIVDEATSRNVLHQLRQGSCTSSAISVGALAATGAIAAKCGIWKGWVHDTLHFKATASSREFVLVILTRNNSHGVMRNLFNDLTRLVP